MKGELRDRRMAVLPAERSTESYKCDGCAHYFTLLRTILFRDPGVEVNLCAGCFAGLGGLIARTFKERAWREGITDGQR